MTIQEFFLIVMVIIFSVPWVLFFFALPLFGEITKEIIFLFLPLITVVGLYWIRWWAIRPPRILSDLANRL